MKRHIRFLLIAVAVCIITTITITHCQSESHAMLIGGSSPTSCYCPRSGCISPEIAKRLEEEAVNQLIRELNEAGISLVSSEPPPQ